MKVMIFWISLVACLASCDIYSSSDRTFAIYSEYVKDSFEIYVNLPDAFSHKDKYDVFYYLDANLKSGKKLRQFIQDSVLGKESCKTIFVGIGHIGNYRMRRRRDFIVPQIENGDTVNISENFGQVEKFYECLRREIIPAIAGQYNTNDGNNSIFGHSFGGLFAIYCLFRDDTLFRNFYSLSPSLWINNYSIYNFNHLPSYSTLDRNLFLSVGDRERINRIKPGADKFDSFIKEKKYPYLKFRYLVYPGEGHNSQVSHSISDIFECNK